VAAVLADFRAWLLAAPADEPPPVPPVDLHGLVSQFVALRHEVNLQTRATRAQQEQSGETLRQLGQAFEVLRQVQTAALQQRQADDEERLRPLLKTLVDLYDALALAGGEMARIQETVLPMLPQAAGPTEESEGSEPEEVEAPAPTAAVPWWARWLGVRAPDTAALAAEITRLRKQRQHDLQTRRERSRQASEAAERVRQMLTALVTGYTMSLQRIERALRQHGLDPIPVVGEPFDPERMEVVEAVTDSERPAGEVVQEVRRGYLWNGRVFRYAQVRVAK
jgi:molecular chaperone GrpE